MRHSREDRAQRHDALYPTACGHVQEQGRVGAPPQLGLDAAKKKEPCTALGGLPGPKRDPRPADRALSSGVQAHDRPDRGKVDKRLRSIVASGVAASWRTRERSAPVAASPASTQPPNAMTIVGMFDGGSP